MNGKTLNQILYCTYVFSFLFFLVVAVMVRTVGVPREGPLFLILSSTTFALGASMIFVMFLMMFHMFRSNIGGIGKSVWFMAFAVGTLVTSFVYFLKVYRKPQHDGGH